MEKVISKHFESEKEEILGLCYDYYLTFPKNLRVSNDSAFRLARVLEFMSRRKYQSTFIFWLAIKLMHCSFESNLKRFDIPKQEIWDFIFIWI